MPSMVSMLRIRLRLIAWAPTRTATPNRIPLLYP
jgi:hypothetical protein